MTIIKVIFIIWGIAMLASIIVFYIGLFGLVPYEIADFCAAFIMTSFLILIVIGLFASFIIPIVKTWRSLL